MKDSLIRLSGRRTSKAVPTELCIVFEQYSVITPKVVPLKKRNMSKF